MKKADVVNMSLLEVMNLPMIKLDRKMLRAIRAIRRNYNREVKFGKIIELYKTNSTKFLKMWGFGDKSMEKLIELMNALGV